MSAIRSSICSLNCVRRTPHLDGPGFRIFGPYQVQTGAVDARMVLRRSNHRFWPLFNPSRHNRPLNPLPAQQFNMPVSTTPPQTTYSMTRWTLWTLSDFRARGGGTLLSAVVSAIIKGNQKKIIYNPPPEVAPSMQQMVISPTEPHSLPLAIRTHISAFPGKSSSTLHSATEGSFASENRSSCMLAALTSAA